MVGYDPLHVDYKLVGNKGGLEAVTLGIEQIPPHKHEVDDYFRFDNSGELSSQFGSVSSGFKSDGRLANTGYVSDIMYFKTHDTKEKGNSESHENRSPYYVLAYIIKL